MNKLQLCVAMAKLDQVKIEHRPIKDDCEDLPVILCALKDNGYEYEEYDPIDNLALNCWLRDKYRVSVNHHDMFVTVWADVIYLEHFKSVFELRETVVRVILKANDLLV